MKINQDIPLAFHESFASLLDSFRNVIASLTWLKASSVQAQQFFAGFPDVIRLTCTVTDQKVKIDKSILALVASEGFNQAAPLCSNTLINFYRVLTIAIKDIVWEEPDFQSSLATNEFQFLRHIRNASAHNNVFFFGNGRQRRNVLNQFPISWRGKVISTTIEGSQLYMNFMAPGDIFILLSDISNLASSRAACP